MSEAAAKIVRLERRVMWRMRLLSLQDSLAVTLTPAGLIAAGFVVTARLRPIAIPVWPVVIGMLSLSIAAVLIRWFLTRTGERDAAFLIDESLELDDRIATSRLIIERGGPTGGLEEALIEDSAARVNNQTPASIAPFRTRRWYPLALVSAIGLVVAIMIPPRSLPVDQALVAERADIATAGEHLEQTAAEIERALPPGTETAKLAQEQAEIGRGFRRAGSSRAEALKRLSALEERIRVRHNDLSNTRADEIVSLSDRRMRDALSTVPTARRTQSGPDDSSLATLADESGGALKKGAAKEKQATTPNSNVRSVESQAANSRQSPAHGSRAQTTAKAERSSTDAAAADNAKQVEPQKRPQEPVSSQGNSNADLTKERGDPEASSSTNLPDQKRSNPSPGDPRADGEKATGENIRDRRADEQERTGRPEDSLEALKAVPDSLAQQAAKSLPRLSEELLKMAAELRANELKPADIEKLRKAAEFLARDLEHIRQSKELQKALQEMARQIRPEQIEQVARELGNQEELKSELEGAARLISENQQAKEMVAGLAGQLARMPDRRQRRDKKLYGGIPDKKARAGDGPSGSNQDAAATPEELETARRLAGQDRESKLKGKVRERSGGEYLYLQSKAGAGAARAPYSSAYPQYRREAERSVQRSHVPPNLRSVVRKYFDAINPDAKR